MLQQLGKGVEFKIQAFSLQGKTGGGIGTGERRREKEKGDSIVI